MSQAVAVRVDKKGRLTIPKRIRESANVKPGDRYFVQSEGSVLHCAKADENPFDFLARHAIEEYRKGKTFSIEEVAAELGVELEGE